MMDLWSFDAAVRAEGRGPLCGVDEAGAGPLAGPVYAAAVVLRPETVLPGLNDSKKLTARQRDRLFDAICREAADYSVAFIPPAEIDEIDILNARIKAMQLAIDGLDPPPALALIDGNRDHGSRCAVTADHRTVVGGDGKSASIAAASILAKVSRDRYMAEVLEREYPQYQFARHKGYGTELHYALLERYGPCPAHRVSFLRKWARRRA